MPLASGSGNRGSTRTRLGELQAGIRPTHRAGCLRVGSPERRNRPVAGPEASSTDGQAETLEEPAGLVLASCSSFRPSRSRKRIRLRSGLGVLGAECKRSARFVIPLGRLYRGPSERLCEESSNRDRRVREHVPVRLHPVGRPARSSYWHHGAIPVDRLWRSCPRVVRSDFRCLPKPELRRRILENFLPDVLFLCHAWRADHGRTLSPIPGPQRFPCTRCASALVAAHLIRGPSHISARRVAMMMPDDQHSLHSASRRSCSS